jgi:hypothetical protein
MSFAALMEQMTQAACRGGGAAVGACFTGNGVYHDVFYGPFEGPAAIADMIDNRFHRDGESFRWNLFDPVDDGAVGYVRYLFSYDSKLKESAGRRSLFEGVGIARLDGDLIAEYHEVTTAATGLSMMGFSPEKIARFAARQARSLTERAEAAGHVGA